MIGQSARDTDGSRASMLSGKDDAPAITSTLDRFRATASVMYESALTEAAALGHSATSGAAARNTNSPLNASGSSAKSTATANGTKAESVIGELGDFF